MPVSVYVLRFAVEHADSAVGDAVVELSLHRSVRDAELAPQAPGSGVQHRLSVSLVAVDDADAR